MEPVRAETFRAGTTLQKDLADMIPVPTGVELVVKLNSNQLKLPTFEVQLEGGDMAR